MERFLYRCGRAASRGFIAAARPMLIGMVAAIAALGSVVYLSPSVAAEDPRISIPLPDGFSSMAVHPITGRVFVATGDRIVVVEPDGSSTATLEDLPGVSGLTIHGDGLYALVSGADRIDRFSTLLLLRTASWPFTTYPLRDSSAFTGGKLFFAVNERPTEWNNRYSSIYSLDPLTGVFDFVINFQFDPILRSSPGLPTSLFIAERGRSYGKVDKWHVGGTTPTRVGTTAHGTYEGNVYDFALTVLGDEMSAAIDVPGEFVRVRPTSLGRIDSYEGIRSPKAVAYSASGIVHAGAVHSSFKQPDVFVHNFRRHGAVHRLHLDDQPAERGLALSPMGDIVYVVEEDYMQDPRVTAPARLIRISLRETGVADDDDGDGDGDISDRSEPGRDLPPAPTESDSTDERRDSGSRSNENATPSATVSRPPSTLGPRPSEPPTYETATGAPPAVGSSQESDESRDQTWEQDRARGPSTAPAGPDIVTTGPPNGWDGGEVAASVDSRLTMEELNGIGPWKRVAATSVLLTAAATVAVRRRIS